ncbi:MAG: hypothetical protein LBP79_07750, partial [Clostridiales bacterium]|nr:hypothetical protein [Clostridiales bacterium]
MAVTRTVHTGFGSRILSSVIGALLGFLLIPGAFIMFFVNEGGVDLSKTAATASEYGETSKTGDLI